MNDRRIDMFGIGNAVLDVEYNVSDSFLKEHEIDKKRMTLVDKDRMLRLIDALNAEAESTTCGGSVANSMYAMQGFGRQTHFACRVAPDEAGHYFVSQLAQVGIGTNAIMPAQDNVTGRCLVLITEDAERTMNTCLGVSDELLASQIDTHALSESTGIFIEGYLASSVTGHAAARHARELADERGLETNLTLADTNMVHHFRAEMESIVGGGLTRIFGNLEEILAWTDTDRLDIAIRRMPEYAKETVITQGPEGCTVVRRDSHVHSEAFAVEPVDLTGAGDVFAAAYLSVIGDTDVDFAARFANYAAAQIIQVNGARFDSVHRYDSIKRIYSQDPQTGLRTAVSSLSG